MVVVVVVVVRKKVDTLLEVRSYLSRRLEVDGPITPTT